MGNDIQISVKVSNQTAGGLASVNSALRTLHQNADRAGQGLRTLATRSATAVQSLRQVKDGADDATRSLRDLAAAGDVRIKARLDDDTSAGIASIKDRLRDLKAQSPVRLQATFDGQSGQITAAATAMRDLRNDARSSGTALDGLAARAAAAAAILEILQQQAEDAARALRTLRGRAAAAAAAMTELRTATTGASNSLRTFNTRAATANTRLGDLGDRTRSLRSDTDDLDGSMRRLTGTLGQLRPSLGTLRASSSGAGGGVQGLTSAALLLAPALLPIAAAAAPVAGNLLAAGVAVAAFGLAVGGQVAAMSKAADAETKYNEAIKEHGRYSAEAQKAEAAYLRTVQDMDPATRRTAAAFSVFKDQYKAWSTSLAGDTMPVVTKAFATFGALLPRLTPAVRGASGELDRLMTVLAGGVNSSGFERLMKTFGEFASGAIGKATDGLVRFMRTMSQGGGSSQFTEFMAYVREAGPIVGQTLSNLGQALTHLVVAASETGVGLLSLINAFAGLVNAIPTDLLSTLLQFVVVFKLVKMAAMGMGGAAGGVAAFGASLVAFRAASAGAGGGLTGLAAGFGALSKAAKVGVVAAGVGLLVVAVSKLADIGREAPPDVDKLTTSFVKLSQTGKVTGEASRLFGSDLDKLHESVRNITDPTLADNLQNGLVKALSFGQWDSTPSKEAQEHLDAIDDSLVKLVQGGKADMAAAALKRLSAAYAKDGKDPKKFRNEMDEYNKALADSRYEQELVADSMGVFGRQSLSVQRKLEAQKQSVTGLQQSLHALNNAYLESRGGTRAMEEAIDAASETLKKNGKGIDDNTRKGRENNAALDAIASSTMKAMEAKYAETGSWEAAMKVYDRGRGALDKATLSATGNQKAAKKLADQLLRTPDAKMRLKMDKDDAEKGLNAFNAAVKRSPKSKTVTVKTLSKGAEAILESFGMKVKRLPNGKVTITSANGKALRGIGDVRGALSRLPKSRNITITVFRKTTIRTIREYQTNYLQGRSQHDIVGATGGLFTGSAFKHGYAEGGAVRGPGTGTSDEVFAPWLSNGEFVMKAAAVQRYGEKFMHLLNEGRLDMPRFARGGSVTKSEAAARKAARGDLTVSHFGQQAGGRLSEIRRGLGDPDSRSSLVSSLNQWRGTIMKSTHGGTERSLLRQLDRYGKSLLKHEKSLSTVNKSLEKAKGKLDDLKNSASQLRDSVKSTVLSSANITKGGGSGDAPITKASVMAGLTRSRDQASAFAASLKGLQKKGLSKDLIAQIAEAGIDGGGLQTAGALMTASKSEIASMNKLQGQIGSSASSAGKTAADSMYASAIKSADKAVKSLTSQQKRLEKAMDKLAHAMEKSIEKAFRRKASGGVVGAAAAGGPRSGLTWVGEQGPELADLPVGSRVYSNPDSLRKAAAPWASMLNLPKRHTDPQPFGGRAGGGAHAERPIVIQLSLGDKELGEVVIDPLRKAVRGRGGLKATFGKVD